MSDKNVIRLSDIPDENLQNQQDRVAEKWADLIRLSEKYITQKISIPGIDTEAGLSISSLLSRYQPSAIIGSDNSVQFGSASGKFVNYNQAYEEIFNLGQQLIDTDALEMQFEFRISTNQISLSPTVLENLLTYIDLPTDSYEVIFHEDAIAQESTEIYNEQGLAVDSLFVSINFLVRKLN